MASADVAVPLSRHFIWMTMAEAERWRLQRPDRRGMNVFFSRSRV